MWWLIIVLLEVIVLTESNIEKKQAGEDPEVEVLSTRTDIEKFVFYDKESKSDADRYVLLHSTDCSRPMKADEPYRYDVFVVGVGLNNATGTFERCEPYDAAMRFDHHGKDTITMYGFANSDAYEIQEMPIKNKADIHCSSVKSWWRQAYGTDLPSWCTFFFVVNTWNKPDLLSIYRDALVSVDGREKDLLIFKLPTDVEENLDRNRIQLNLIERTIIGKKIPRIFLDSHPEFRTSTSTTESPTTEDNTTNATQEGSTTQEDQQTSTAQATVKGGEPGVDQRESTPSQDTQSSIIPIASPNEEKEASDERGIGSQSSAESTKTRGNTTMTTDGVLTTQEDQQTSTVQATMEGDEPKIDQRESTPSQDTQSSTTPIASPNEEKETGDGGVIGSQGHGEALKTSGAKTTSFWGQTICGFALVLCSLIV